MRHYTIIKKLIDNYFSNINRLTLKRIDHREEHLCHQQLSVRGVRSAKRERLVEGNIGRAVSLAEFD